jgi:autotransporter adhesin
VVVDGGGIKYFHTNSTLADSSATGADAVAIGGAASATADNSVALGSNSVANRANSVSVGAVGAERQIVNVANATSNTDAVNLGQLRALGGNVDSEGNVTNAFVSYDDDTKDKISLRGAGSTVPVLLTNVAQGQVAASSSDAVTGAQLYNLAQSAADVAGGGAGVLPDGTLSRPSYVIIGQTFDNVGSALSAVDGEMGQMNTTFSTGLKYIKVVSTDADAVAGGNNAIAIGGASYASGNGTLAIGSGSSSTFDNSTALGVNAQTDAPNTVSVGNRNLQMRITNVANGINPTDAATVAQLDALQTQLTSGSTGGAKSMMQSPSAVLSYIAVSSNTVQGTTTSASEDMNAMAIGPAAAAAGSNALALGARAGVASDFGTAVGSGAAALSANATAIGASSIVGVDSANSVSIGYNTRVNSTNALALGAYAFTAGAGAVALGYNAFVTDTGTSGLALGSNSTASAANGVAIGYGSIADRANAVSVGNSATQRQIINVAAGVQDTDAVNLAQMNAAISASASSGSADAVIYDTPSHDKLTLNKGGAAVTVSNLANGVADTDAVNVSQLKSMGMTLDSSGNATNAFVAYDDTTRQTVTFGGIGSTTPVVLANVGAGQVASNSKQAINGSQLYGAMNSAAAALGGGSAVGSDGQVSKPVYTVGDNSYTGVDSAISALNAAIVTGGNPDGVIYDTSAHDKLTLGGTGNASKPAVTIANVAAATADDEAVNLKQLKDAGLTVDSSGNPTNSFVSYDDATRKTLTFNPNGDATRLRNVADGLDPTDAVNLRQMQSYVSDYVSNNPGSGGTQNAVAYDDSSKKQVTLGGTNATDQVVLTNVAAGSNATDAVNYGQFSALLDEVKNLSVPTEGGNNYFTVGSPEAGTTASAAVASGTDAIAIGNGAAATGTAAIAIGKSAVTSGANSVALGAGASAPNDNAVALGANSTTDRDNSVSVGSAGAERQITNLAAGTQGTDAVNVNQLNSAMGNMNSTINNVDRNAAKGIASASALNIVTPYLPGRTTLNAGIANYRGYQAVGLGISRWNEKGTINYNLGVSSSGGNSTIVRAGIGIVLGN